MNTEEIEWVKKWFAYDMDTGVTYIIHVRKMIVPSSNGFLKVVQKYEWRPTTQKTFRPFGNIIKLQTIQSVLKDINDH